MHMLAALCEHESILENHTIIMGCEQSGGACDLEFRAETFEEMSEFSKQHGLEMRQKQDVAHLEAMKKVGELMKSPEDMSAWFESRRQEFEALPESGYLLCSSR